MEATIDPALLLKVNPPKLRKSLLVRERLRRMGSADEDVAVILVDAPAGYGKTSLIAQWRLDWLQHGAAVAWLNLDAGDSPITLVSGMVLGLRRSTGRADFGADAIEALRRNAGCTAALTALLAEVAEASSPIVLVLDNGERLGDVESVEVLGYLLHNLPPNLRVVIGTRSPLRTDALDLVGRGLLRRITASDLRFDLAESIRFLQTQLGARIDTDLGARLAEIAGGWPLGLQLAAAALERATDPALALEEFAKSHDDATQHLFERLLASLPPDLADFLTACSMLDSLHPSLCEAATGVEDAAYALQRLVVETPLVSATEDGEWLRLHPLAREFLRSRAEATLTDEERREFNIRAWRWYAAHGLPERAARHALRAGFRVEALDLIATALNDEYDLGHHGSVAEWLSRIPVSMIEADPRLRVIALWMSVLGHRFDEAQAHAKAVAVDPNADEGLRGGALVALAGAYAVADRQDEERRLAEQCEPMTLNARGRQALGVLWADLACNAGDTERARGVVAPVAGEAVSPAIQVWRDYFVLWSYLWEGRPVLAEQVGRLQHARWEAEVGRRGLRAATLGSLLAAACWQQDRRSDAMSLLADRLDVIETAAGYAGSIGAYLVLARMAALTGDEPRAFSFLEGLAAIGERRGTVRLGVVSLAERIRLHCAARRPTQAAVLLTRLTELVERSPTSSLLAPQLRLEVSLAGACTAMAADCLADARRHVREFSELALKLNRGYEATQALALEALLAERSGQPAVPLLSEALSRAAGGGLVRVFADTLPEVVGLLRRNAQACTSSAVNAAFIGRVLAAAEPAPLDDAQVARATGNALLTPKENWVLRLLAGGLPNKRIAVEMDLSAETVKWHVRKVMAKLNASNREHAVHRARMLGLLQ